MSARRRSIAEGILHDAGDDSPESYLIGGRCPVCGLILFPAAWICPRCLDRERRPEPVRLSGEGVLERFCVTERGAPEFSPPYVQAHVRLAEGPVIFSLVKEVDEAAPELERGQRVRLVVRTVRTEADGTELVGWVTIPAGSVP